MPYVQATEYHLGYTNNPFAHLNKALIAGLSEKLNKLAEKMLAILILKVMNHQYLVLSSDLSINNSLRGL